MKTNNAYTIGVDFGSDSVRAVLVNAGNGEDMASHVYEYKRWKMGKYCSPADNMFRQHLLDHIEGMQETIANVVSKGGVAPKYIKGICIDTTGSSPVPVTSEGIPLSLLPKFSENPNAMMVLWKDHTAIKEAQEINELAMSWQGENYLNYSGGSYSSEWFWAKILHISRQDLEVKKEAFTWVEHCDLMTFMLIEEEDISKLKRSRCAAGHKALWHDQWGGMPADEFLGKLDPYLVDIKKTIPIATFTSDQVAGRLNEKWAGLLGLEQDVIVAVGTFDAHAGAVGAEIRENTLVKVMGTSTCDMLVSSNQAIDNAAIPGICGQVDGSIVPNLIGLEAGQSAFGDVLAWFRDLVSWSVVNVMPEGFGSDNFMDRILPELSARAAKLPHMEGATLALDWLNGRRTPNANQNLKAAIANLNLGTDAPHIFKALVESICFGSKRIIDHFRDEGVKIESVVAIGGVAKKSDFIMQTLADILGMPIKLAASEQAPALGGAMYASVAAGIHNNIAIAIKVMGQGFEKIYNPNPSNSKYYSGVYSNYLKFGEFVEQQLVE